MSEKAGAYKYFAFISYKSEDLREAWKLKKKLDSYRLPAILCRQYAKESKPTYEAFLDKTNIQPGNLTEELRANLDNAHYLIVVCSPRSAQSKYVTEEIDWFTRNGREDEMFLFIIDSDPTNIDACFNPAIKRAEQRWSERTGEKHEILGVNIHEKDVDKLFFLYRWPIIGARLQRERALMQLISKLIGLDFKQLWSYQQIRLVEKLIAWFVGLVIVFSALFATWHVNRPVDVAVQLRETSVHNDNLPPLHDAIVTLRYSDVVETDTFHTIADSVFFLEIAQKHLHREARVQLSCSGWLDVDTTLYLTERMVLDVQRDPSVYGDVRFLLWSQTHEQPVVNTVVEIAGQTALSDEAGQIRLFIPLTDQRTAYAIKASVPLLDDTIYMPCGPQDMIAAE